MCCSQLLYALFFCMLLILIILGDVQASTGWIRSICRGNFWVNAQGEKCPFLNGPSPETADPGITPLSLFPSLSLERKSTPCRSADTNDRNSTWTMIKSTNLVIRHFRAFHSIFLILFLAAAKLELPVLDTL